MLKKSEKKSEKIRKNNLKMFNYTGIDDILPIFDQSWKKKEDSKVLYKLLLTQAKNHEAILANKSVCI